MSMDIMEASNFLRSRGIPFTEHNFGMRGDTRAPAELVIAGRYRFWPATGTWRDMSLKITGKGLVALVAAYTVKP